MSTISIHVPSPLASIYEKANKAQKQKVEQFISAWLESFLTVNPATSDKLLDIMQYASKTAQENGLTESTLQEILGEED